MERSSEIRPSSELILATRQGIELWRPVPNADGWYDVSNLGCVRSWIVRGGRHFDRARATEPTILAACPNRAKYPYLCVTLYLGGRQRYVPVHNLVCEAFIGPRPGSPKEWHAGHEDDDQTNNRLDNLKWCTKKANGEDMARNGLSGRRPIREIAGVKHYQCTGPCREWKPVDQFRKLVSRESHCGIHSQCIPCHRDSDNARKRAKRAARKSVA